MSDETAHTPLSTWLPSLETVKAWKWGHIAKLSALCAMAWVAYVAYDNSRLLSDYLRPAPPPTVVEYVPAAKFKALEAEVASLKGDGLNDTGSVSLAEFEALKVRVQAIEDGHKKRGRR